MEASKITNKCVYGTFLCAALCFVWSTQDMLHLQIPLSTVVELRKEAETCAQETGVPATHLKKIIDKTLPKDKPNKQFFQCVGFNGGFVDKDGHFVLDKMLTFQIMNGTKDDFVKTITDCNKITLDENIDTLFAAADCIHKNYIVTIKN